MPTGEYRSSEIWGEQKKVFPGLWFPLTEPATVSSLQNDALEDLIRPQSNTDITFHIEDALKQIKKIEVNIPQPGAVRDYLVRYSDITSLITLVCSMAREELGVDTQLSLEVYRDPEIEDEYLALYVRQESYDELIMDKIEELCAEYEEELTGKSGWFIVTTDFRPPR
ncbi:MAG: hypothetical protein ACE5EE_11600 [Fidelibacterota bacterium]